MANLTNPDPGVASPPWWSRADRVPGWAWRTAHLIALLTVPSALWRLGIVFGVEFGYDPGWIERSRLDTPFGGFRMIMLSVISELLALLALGLVQRWGERVPPWLPVLRGRPIDRRVPFVLATLGAIGLIVAWTFGVPYVVITGTTFDPGMDPGLPFTIQLVSYAPMVLWGPLLLILAGHYLIRRSGR